MKQKVVTYDKLSKKKKKEVDRLKRLDWGQVRPETVTLSDGSEYNRQRMKRELEKKLEEGEE